MDEIHNHLKVQTEAIRQLVLDDVVSAMTSVTRKEHFVEKLRNTWNKVLEQHERGMLQFKFKQCNDPQNINEIDNRVSRSKKNLAGSS